MIREEITRIIISSVLLQMQSISNVWSMSSNNTGRQTRNRTPKTMLKYLENRKLLYCTHKSSKHAYFDATALIFLKYSSLQKSRQKDRGAYSNLFTFQLSKEETLAMVTVTSKRSNADTSDSIISHNYTHTKYTKYSYYKAISF